jgi:hypothetical protein
MDLNDLEFNPWKNYVPLSIEDTSQLKLNVKKDLSNEEITSFNEELLETISALDNYNQQNFKETCSKNLKDRMENTNFFLYVYKVEEKFDQPIEVKCKCMNEIQGEVTPIKHCNNTEPPDAIVDNFNDLDDKFDNPIVQEINDDVIEWKCQLEIPVITLSENQLGEWYLKREICDRCGIPKSELQT